MTYVGTMRQNKRDIPDVMRPSKQREEHSSIFGFLGPLTYVSFVKKKGKAVVLLSRMHHDTEVVV